MSPLGQRPRTGLPSPSRKLAAALTLGSLALYTIAVWATR